MRLLLTCLLALGLPAAALAQDAPERVTLHYQMEVKAGHRAQFEEAFKKHVAFRKSEGDPWDWEVWAPAISHSMNSFVVRSQSHTWAEIDDYAFQREKGMAHFEETVMPHLTAVHASMDRLDEELSHSPDEADGMPALVALTHHWLEPGKAQQWREAAKTVSKAVVDQDFTEGHFILWQEAGGKVPAVTIVFPQSNWADMQSEDQRTLLDVLAAGRSEAEAKKILDRLDDAVAHTVREIYAFRSDLSLIRDEGGR